MISEIRIAKPVSRIKFWNPRRLFVFGYPWYGPVFTVGTGMMYSTLYNSLAAQKEPTVHLLFPSAVQGTDISGLTFNGAIIKGVRLNSLVELSISGQNNIFGVFSTNVILEGVNIRCTYSNWSSAFMCNGSSNVFLNKCWLNADHHGYNYPIYGQSSGNTPQLYINNCYISIGYCHFAFMNLGGTRLWKVETEGAIGTTSTTGSLVENDSVSSPTIGYGYNYGSFIVTGVEDYCQIS